MSVLERHIEDPVVDYAKKRGCIVRKMNGLGNRAWPDRMFLFRGRVLFIEFKKPGEVATPLQAHFHGLLIAAGFDVFVVDNKQNGIDLVETHLFNGG